MPKSTADCKKFLAEFFGRNTQIVMALYGEHSPEQQALLSKAANWKRMWKMNADRGDDDYSISDGLGGSHYLTYIDGAPAGHLGEGQARRKPSEFVIARGFSCDAAGDDVAYIVLESADGTLTLGHSIGV